MSYIEKNLMTGESIMYRAKLHWIVFLWPIIWFVLAGLSLTKYGNTEGGKILAGIFILLAIIMGIGSQIKYSTSEFGITNKRVIVKVGFIRRNSIEVLLSKVEGIQVNQGILGRILGYGSIVVSGTGGTKGPFHKISNPFEFRKKAQEQIAAVQESK
jgi:uncharacterized membrane protein YdbT with pleckstrin-like domain